MYHYKTKNYKIWLHRHSGKWPIFNRLKWPDKSISFTIGWWSLDCWRRGTRGDKLMEEWELNHYGKRDFIL